MKKRILVILTALVAILFSACYEPSPLYGTWSDNDGNSITFIVDGTFNAKIKTSDSSIIKYQGDYNVIDNVISFTYTSSDDKSGHMNSEWDIRGSLMYIEWSVEGTTKRLTLYHFSK